MKKIESFYRVFLLALLTVAGAWGQATSSLSGTVTDPTGAVVPGASLQLDNVASGLTRQTKSDAAGRFIFAQVQPGLYKLTGKASGFADVIVNELRLQVNVPVTSNVRFEKVGSVAETIAVTAEATQINTTDASIGNAITTRPIVELPLNGRNIVSLLALQPGVVFTREDDTDSRNGAVNGGKSDQGNVTLDGVDVNDQMDRNAFTSVLRMTPDSMQEFRVTTMNANADSGRTSGAQMVLITKGGTNEMHGSLYEYHRNTVTSANSFFNNQAGVDRQKLIRNVFGVSVGGPVKKNKLFYFFNYEGRRDAKDSSVVRTIPSMDMRQGILHYLRKDNSTATVTPADIASKLDARGVNQAALAVFQKYPVPNDNTVGDGLNQTGYRFKASTPLTWNTYISRVDYHIDSASKHTMFVRGNLQNDDEAALPQFPGMQPNSQTLRNNKGLAVGLTSVLRPSLINTFRYGLTRQGGDSTGLQTRAMVTFRGIDPLSPTTRNFSAIIPVHTFTDDINWTKGAHQVQFGAVARMVDNKRRDFGNSFSSASANASWLVSSGAGLSSPFTDMASSAITLFRWSMTDVMGLITQGNAQYNYLANGTAIGEGNAVMRNFAAKEFEFYAQDSWKVNRSLTVTAGLRWSLAPPIHEANGQQVSPNVRIGDWFDLRGSLAERGLSQMEAGRITFSPIGSANARDMYDYHKRNFAPRLAMAWSPQWTSGIGKAIFGGPGKSSIRAGFGMYYDLFGSGLMRSASATAFGLSSYLTNPSATLSIATAPRFTGIYDIPGAVLLPDPGAKFPAAYPDSFAITNGVDDTIKPPYNMSANLTWGREFSGGWFAQASYVGRFSRRSLIRRDAAMPTNLKDPKSGQTYFEAATILARLAVAKADPKSIAKVPFFENMYSNIAGGGLSATQVAYSEFQANMWDWTTALYDMDTGAGQGNCVKYQSCSNLGPYAMFHPQFSYLSVFSSVGEGDYHGGQLSLRKRFGDGGSLDFNYTLSKSIDLRSNTERVGSSTGVIWNPWSPNLQRGVSDYDTTHLFNMMGVYSLPFGKGKRFAGTAPGWANAVIGGWQVSGMWRWSSGFPVSVYETGVWPTNWNNNVWASWTGTPINVAQTKNAPSIAGKGGPNMFPDPAAAIKGFQYVMPGEVGTRNPIRGDGVFNIDTALSKRFVLPGGEGKRSIQIRWETFNLSNTTRFDVGTASLDVSIAGTFGKYTDQLGTPRVMQFGLRAEF